MKILVIFPHPDDEVYGPGGTLIRYAAEGHTVRLVTLTRGEAGSLGICKTMEPEPKAAMRVKELEAAVEVMGLSEFKQMQLPDKKLESYPENEGVSIVLNEVESFKPDILITFHNLGVSSHPDHIAVSRWCRTAIEQSAHPTRLLYSGVTEEQASLLFHVRNVVAFRPGEMTHAISVADVFEKKLEAIRCHESQLDLLAEFDKAPGGYRAVGEVEYFAQVYPASDNHETFDDLAS